MVAILPILVMYSKGKVSNVITKLTKLWMIDERDSFIQACIGTYLCSYVHKKILLLTWKHTCIHLFVFIEKLI